MKKILLVMSVIAVLFLAGCQKNDNVGNDILQNESNEIQETVVEYNEEENEKMDNDVSTDEPNEVQETIVESNEKEILLDENYDSNGEATIWNNESDEVIDPLTLDSNVIGNIKDRNGEIYKVVSYTEIGTLASAGDDLILILNGNNKVVYYFEKGNQTGIKLKSTGEWLDEVKIENNIIRYYELGYGAVVKNEIEIIGFDEETYVIEKEHRKIQMYNFDELDLVGAVT